MTKSYRLLTTNNTDKIKVYLLVRNELNSFLQPNFSYEDVVTARLDSGGELWLISTYMPHDDEVKPPSELLGALAEARQRGANVVLGWNANSRHSVWACSDIC